MHQHKFSKAERQARTFLRVAKVMREVWEEKGSTDTRLLMEPLVPDELVQVGESLQGIDHKEHVVPRLVICQLCHQVFENGGSDLEAADIIARLLKIVRISKAEQRKLDLELGLKQTMPQGWDPRTGSPFARLLAAGIVFSQYSD